MGDKVDAVGCSLDTDKDGVNDAKDQCPETPLGRKVDRKGCEMDSDFDGVFDHLDQCPNTLRGVQVDAKGCPIKKDQDLSKLAAAINFKTGKADLTSSSYATLDKVVKLMLEFKDAKLEIQGHTDNRGKAEMNRKLSQRRAQSVVDYIVGKGVALDRLVAAGFGPDRPVAENTTEAGRAKNRRTEILPIQSAVEQNP
jgi:OOP family OmpA-OmpF porin